MALRFAGEVISGGQAHLRCDNSASMKQQRAGVISATSVLKIGPEPCTCSSHSEVMSASPSAYVGVGLQGNECDWLCYFQYFLPFFTLHAYCMLCFFNFVIFVFTSPLVAARDSGLFVNAVQPGGPAEGKVSKSSCLWSSSSRFPSSIFNQPSHFAGPVPLNHSPQVQAGDIIIEIDGRVTSGLTATEGSKLPSSPKPLLSYCSVHILRCPRIELYS